MSDADAFLREHRPSFDYTRGGEYVAVCAGCTRAAGDYVEWPCAHIWGAADVLARRDDLLAEAECRGAERGWQRGWDDATFPPGHSGANPYRAGDDQ